MRGVQLDDVLQRRGKRAGDGRLIERVPAMPDMPCRRERAERVRGDGDLGHLCRRPAPLA